MPESEERSDYKSAVDGEERSDLAKEPEYDKEPEYELRNVWQKKNRVTGESLAELQAELELHLPQHPHPDEPASLGPEATSLAVRLLTVLAEDCERLRELLRGDHQVQHYAAFASLGLVAHRARSTARLAWESSLPAERLGETLPCPAVARAAGLPEQQPLFDLEELREFPVDAWRSHLAHLHRRELEDKANLAPRLSGSRSPATFSRTPTCTRPWKLYRPERRR